MTVAKLGNEKGLTVVEVLVAAVVFMIGFSVLVAMMGQMVSRFSVPEIAGANLVGEKVMQLTLEARDTTSLDTVMTQSEMKFKVSRRTKAEDGLVHVHVSVRRVGRDKLLLELYNEFATTGQ